MYPELKENLQALAKVEISEERIQVLAPLIDYIKQKRAQKESINLNFICTHNSRRSQFSQVWAHTAAIYHGLSINAFSGGVEVTAFNPRAVDALRKSGFKIAHKKGDNPHYLVSLGEDEKPALAFSKLFDNPVNQAERFAAVMTCSDADENCPFVPGTEQRISVNYEDPKAFDDSPQEAEMYLERSKQIASEMLYVFSQV